jgi:hypothetical protein
MTFQSAFAPDFLEEGSPEKKGLRGGRSAEGTLFYITQPGIPLVWILLASGLNNGSG